MRGTYWKVKEGIQELVYRELVSRPSDKEVRGGKLVKRNVKIAM